MIVWYSYHMKMINFPTLIADALRNAPRYAHEDAPILVAQLVRDFPIIRPDVVEEVVSMACDMIGNSNFRANLELDNNPDVMSIMHICMIKHHGNVEC